MKNAMIFVFATALLFPVSAKANNDGNWLTWRGDSIIAVAGAALGLGTAIGGLVEDYAAQRAVVKHTNGTDSVSWTALQAAAGGGYAAVVGHGSQFVITTLATGLALSVRDSISPAADQKIRFGWLIAARNPLIGTQIVALAGDVVSGISSAIARSNYPDGLDTGSMNAAVTLPWVTLVPAIVSYLLFWRAVSKLTPPTG